MRLGLSSAVAPAAPFEELVAMCARRGLAALELRDRDDHGIGNDALMGVAAAKHAGAAGVTITGYRIDRPRGRDLRFARLAEALAAPLLVGGEENVAARIERGAALKAVGAEVAIVVQGDVSSGEVERVVEAGLALAWDADAPAVGRVAKRLLPLARGRLRHIRFRGGGPESVENEGQGVGELMARLALASYTGSVILAPSSPRYHTIWEAWAGRRGGWGCGSKESDASLVRLDGALTSTGVQ